MKQTLIVEFYLQKFSILGSMQVCLLCLRAKYTHDTNMLISLYCFDLKKKKKGIH